MAGPLLHIKDQINSSIGGDGSSSSGVDSNNGYGHTKIAPVVTGALAGVGGSLLGSVVNYFTARSNMDRANDYNRQLASQQNAWNLAQWNRENEYNLPINQMQRLKDAGINPNLYYAQGQGYNVAAQSPQLTAGQPSQVQPGMQLDLAQHVAELSLLKAQTDNTNAHIVTGKQIGRAHV